MVSTRGPRYKFSEGEKVLCYEPDPTKAKVLYDSKVLEVIKSKDKRGRPIVEYLIHFQGWNSSWDRVVSEDFVLKDTEENRQLQKSLAEKSQLHIGTYLYRRERKKTTTIGSNSSVGNASSEKRGRKRGLECEGSSSSGDLEEREDCDSDSSSRSDSSCTTGDERKPEPVHDPQTSLANAAINLGPGIRDRLTMDFQLIMKQGRIMTLPARPNVLEILEGCVRQFAAREATSKPRQRRSRVANPPQPQDHLAELLNKLNILREIADGIRVYFDYSLNSHLLYKPEYIQYKDALSKNVIMEARVLKSLNFLKDKEEQPNNVYIKCPIKTENQSPREDDPQLPPSPKNEDGSNRPDGPARRLRSHKLSQASETSEEPLPSVPPSSSNPGPSNIELNSSSVSGSPGPQELTNLGCDIKGAISETIQRALRWHIVPAEHPSFPSAVYGATHLARLFVKLPEFLSAINMAEMKLKLITKNIEIFVDYLEEHEEWFGESCYCEANPGPS